MRAGAWPRSTRLRAEGRYPAQEPVEARIDRRSVWNNYEFCPIETDKDGTAENKGLCLKYGFKKCSGELGYEFFVARKLN